MNGAKLLTLALCLFVSTQFAAHGAKTAQQTFSLGIDKYRDLYMVDSATGVAHHFDSETGIYLGKFIDADEIRAKSLTDISVCACGGAIALLDPDGNTIHVVDFEGSFLWKKSNSEPGMNFRDAVAIGICQDSNYEHVILTTKSGEIYHVSPPNEENKIFPEKLTEPGGAYMDFYKQVFIVDSSAGVAIKTDQWGKKSVKFGEGILKKPVDIATSEDKERKIWVCDQVNARLHVFSKDLKHLFDCGEGYLTNPVSVITDYIDSGAYVAEIVDGKPQIHKFDANGAYLFTIRDANNVPQQTLLSLSLDSYVLQNRNNRALNRRLINPPQIIDGELYVEARPVFESMGFVVGWDEKTRTASFSKDGKTVSVSMPEQVWSDGDGLSGQIKAVIIKKKMLLPAQFISEHFDVTINNIDNMIFLVHPKLLPWQTMPQPDMGKKLFETKCSRCHQPPVPDVKYRSEWTPIVQRMMQKESGWISDKEADLITRYLWGQAKPDKLD
jgi:hypothetical protein